MPQRSRGSILGGTSFPQAPERSCLVSQRTTWASVLQPLLLGLDQLCVSLEAFSQEGAPIVIFSRTGDPFQPLGVPLRPPVRREPHQGAQCHPQQILPRRVLLPVQGRQTDVGVLEAD